jgi:hypothetical protein
MLIYMSTCVHVCHDVRDAVLKTLGYLSNTKNFLQAVFLLRLIGVVGPQGLLLHFLF